MGCCGFLISLGLSFGLPLPVLGFGVDLNVVSLVECSLGCLLLVSKKSLKLSSIILYVVVSITSVLACASACCSCVE